MKKLDRFKDLIDYPIIFIIYLLLNNIFMIFHNGYRAALTCPLLL